MYFLHHIVRRYQNTAYNYNNLKQDSIHVLYFERLTLRLKDRRNYVTMIFPLCPVNKQKILRKEYFIRTNTLKNLTVILSLFMSRVCQEQRKIEQNKRITPSQFLLRLKSPNSKQMNSWQCFFNGEIISKPYPSFDHAGGTTIHFLVKPWAVGCFTSRTQQKVWL